MPDPIDKVEAKEMHQALKDFVKVGKLLRSPGSCFEQSVAKQLQNCLVSFETETAGFLGKGEITEPEVYDAETTFVALAAPSFVGKTQLAFTFDDTKLITLYFPLSNLQSIYKNYSHWHAALNMAALADFDALEEKYPSIFNRKNIETFGAENLSNSYAHVSFWTLGLFLGIMKHASQKKESFAKTGWMKHFAEIKHFPFEPVSINDFKVAVTELNSTKFVLFLDEFQAAPDCIFVRNVVRAAGLRCIVANTNSKITNLIGTSSASRRAKPIIWALVVTRLDGVHWRVLDELFKLNNSLRLLEDMLGKSLVGRSFVSWLKREILNTRPGIAALFANALRSVHLVVSYNMRRKKLEGGDIEFSDSLKVTSIMDFLCRLVAKHLIGRKDGLRSDAGYRANLGLLVPESFDNSVMTSATDIRGTGKFNHINSLEKHFYFLCNPSNPKDWKYLTLLETDMNTHKLSHFGPTGQPQTTRQFTYFCSDERLTMLACWFLPYRTSVFGLSREAEYDMVGSEHFFHQQNTEASSFSGNYLENVAACAACLASHSLGNPGSDGMRFSIAPKDGNTFLHNFIRNVSAKDEYMYWDQSKSPANGEFDLKAHLAKFQINFLFAINRDDQEFEKLHMKSYKRPKDSARIDGLFAVKYDGETTEASIECKNYQGVVSRQMLERAVVQAAKHKLAIILVTKIADDPNVTELKKICRREKMNLLRYVGIDSNSTSGIGSFYFEQFGSMTLLADPDKLCLVIELHKVNSRFPVIEDEQPTEASKPKGPSNSKGPSKARTSKARTTRTLKKPKVGPA